MARRLSLLLLHIAAVTAAVPGCNQFQQGRLLPRKDGTDDVAYRGTSPRRQGSDAARTAEKRSPEDRPTSLPANAQSTAPTIGSAVEEPEEPAPPAPEPRATLAAPARSEPRPPPLVEALRCMLEEHPQEALKHLQAYDPQTQEIFLKFLPTMTLFAKKRLSDLAPQEVAVLNEHLYGMLTELTPLTELAIDRLCFCKEVKGFANYQALPADYAFLAGSADRPGESGELVQLYFEVRNFSSEPRDGIFETRLVSSVEIRDSRGTVRRRLAPPGAPQSLLNSTRVHDYHDSYLFHVPPELEPGTYELTLQVIDQTAPNSQRVARKSIEFRVSATR